MVMFAGAAAGDPPYVPGLPYSEEWVAEQLLAAPDGVLTREQLREAAAELIPGSVRSSAKGHGSNGRRSSRYVTKGVQSLAREGLVVRVGEYVAVLGDEEPYDDGWDDEGDYELVPGRRVETVTVRDGLL